MIEANLLIEYLESSELDEFSFFSKLHSNLKEQKKKKSFKCDQDDAFNAYLAVIDDITSEDELQSQLKDIKKKYNLNDKDVWKTLITRGFASRVKSGGKRRKVAEYSEAVRDLSQEIKPEIVVKQEIEQKIEEIEQKIEEIEQKNEEIEQKNEEIEQENKEQENEETRLKNKTKPPAAAKKKIPFPNPFRK